MGNYFCICAYKYSVSIRPIFLKSTSKDHNLYATEIIRAVFKNTAYSPPTPFIIK